ncbi:hypothetical protein L7F22_057609 [Adiantum nelumboides]|nr:hypothetical protein [Adiantum nelumboides]
MKNPHLVNPLEMVEAAVGVVDAAWTAVERHWEHAHHDVAAATWEDCVKLEGELIQERSENHRLKVALEELRKALHELKEKDCNYLSSASTTSSLACKNGQPADFHERLQKKIDTPAFLERLKNMHEVNSQEASRAALNEASLEMEDCSSWVVVPDKLLEMEQREEISDLDDDGFLLISQDDVIESLAAFVAKLVVSNPNAKSMSPLQIQEDLMGLLWLKNADLMVPLWLKNADLMVPLWLKNTDLMVLLWLKNEDMRDERDGTAMDEKNADLMDEKNADLMDEKNAGLMAMDLGIRRGISARMVELDAAIPDDWQQVLRGCRDMPLHDGWWASFDRAGRPLIARYGTLVYGVADVQPPGVHRRIVFQGLVSVFQHPNLYWQPIRIVGSLGKRCTVDPVIPIEEAMFWRLWIWEGSPLSQIVWDLGEWFWPSQQRLGEEVMRGDTAMLLHDGWWGYFDENGVVVLVTYQFLLLVAAVHQDSSLHVCIQFDLEDIGSVLPGLVMRGDTAMLLHDGWWGYFDENGVAVLVTYQFLLLVAAVHQDSSLHVCIQFDLEDIGSVLPGLNRVPKLAAICSFYVAHLETLQSGVRQLKDSPKMHVRAHNVAVWTRHRASIGGARDTVASDLCL